MMRVLAFAAAVVLVLLPALADNYLLRVATTMLMYSALALGWNFIGGFAGYPSFATAAFFGLGAYASGVLQTMGVPMPAAWALGGAIVACSRPRSAAPSCICAATTSPLRAWWSPRCCARSPTRRPI